MQLNLHPPPKPLSGTPLIYLITSGETTSLTTPQTKDFENVLDLVKSAVDAEIDLVQIREKQLSAGVLYELAAKAVSIVDGSATRLLVNDRFDVARSAGASGVHLTSSSLPTEVVRKSCGDNFLIGVSTHSLEQAERARQQGADFVLFGPVYETTSKRVYGPPQGVDTLGKVASALSPFPVLALGGITIGKVAECLRAGARGIAGIGMLNDPARLGRVVKEVRKIASSSDESEPA